MADSSQPATMQAVERRFKQKYAALLSRTSHLASIAYRNGGEGAMTKAINASKAPMYDMLAANYRTATHVGIMHMVVRGVKSRFVDPRDDEEFINGVADAYVDSWAGPHASMITDTSLKNAKHQVEAGLRDKMTPTQIASMIRQAGESDARAAMIARTETAGAWNSATNDAATAMEDSVGPLQKQWLAANDERTRETHADADGQTVDMDESFKVGGVDMNFPADPECIDASEIVNCRCTCIYVPK